MHSTSSDSAWTAAAEAAVARFDPGPSWVRSGASVVVSLASRFVMQGLNRVGIIGLEHLQRARELQVGRGLLTFSNHVSLFDDPLLLACFVGPRWSELRWVAADAHNFFGTPLKAAISNMGKAVPVVRGAGFDQPGMRILADLLQKGEWVHVFPEGGRTRTPDSSLQLPLKSGLGHLVEHARPVVLPFHHSGMQAVLPLDARLPRAGHQVTVRFAEPRTSDDLGDTAAITAWAEHQLLTLEAEARP